MNTPEYGKTLVMRYARMGGSLVGIVANQKCTRQATDSRRRPSAWSLARDLYRISGEGCALHHGLQPEFDSAWFFFTM